MHHLSVTRPFDQYATASDSLDVINGICSIHDATDTQFFTIRADPTKVLMITMPSIHAGPPVSKISAFNLC